MRTQLSLAAICGLQVAAFPAVMNQITDKRQVPSTGAAQALSQSRTNCGPTPCLVFDEAAQYVSTTGDHAYASPAPSQIRGLCPGLNAAANHGYLDRSGVVTIANTITGLGEAYGMSVDLSGFLAAYAILIDGDPIAGTWSIGGPSPPNLDTAIVGEPPGISFSHNNYEGDSSIARKDAFLNNGDAHSLDTSRFASAYAVGVDDGSDRYTLDKFAQNFGTKVQESIMNNPYYFAAPFATTLVAPAAYNFVINFMSNRTAEEPSGYFNGDMFKTFFAITGDYPNFTWLPGQERIPDNWYRRTNTNPYSIADALDDVAVQYAAYPDTFRLGGNTAGTNTYGGIDLSDLTGGAYELSHLTDPSNKAYAACFYSQLAQVVTPDFANQAAPLVTAVTGLLDQYIKPIAGATDCAPIDNYNAALFSKYPGYSYSPTGPANNYKS